MCSHPKEIGVGRVVGVYLHQLCTALRRITDCHGKDLRIWRQGFKVFRCQVTRNVDSKVHAIYANTRKVNSSSKAVDSLIHPPSHQSAVGCFSKFVCSITELSIGDSAEMPGGRCSNCIAFDSECTHVTAKVSFQLIVSYVLMTQFNLPKETWNKPPVSRR